MNIFHLSKDLELSARYHCDRHVVRMILEYAQMLSTANKVYGLDEGYKIAHLNHPCTIWVRSSLDNWLYLRDLAYYCNKEYKFRYDKSVNHKSYDVIKSLTVPNIPKLGLTRPPLCMPDDAKLEKVVQSYRNFYRLYKISFVTWKKRKIPPFIRDLVI